MDVNRNAPLVVRREIEIFAPPEMIWEWLSRVELWQDWHPEISRSHWAAGQGPNGVLKWRLRKVIGVTAQVESWHEQNEIGWVGHAWSTTVRQVFRIRGDFRKTRIVTEASVEGPGFGFPPLRAVVQSQLERTSELWLGALKTKLESEKTRVRIGGTTPPPPKTPIAPIGAPRQ